MHASITFNKIMYFETNDGDIFSFVEIHSATVLIIRKGAYANVLVYIVDTVSQKIKIAESLASGLDYLHKYVDNRKRNSNRDICDIPKIQNAMMSKQEAAGKKETLKWTENMDNAFIQAMITQKDNGNRVNGTFTSNAYDNMAEELSTKFQMKVSKKHMKNRLKTLKDHFAQWYDLFRRTSLSGFSWNLTTLLNEAEDEVWKKLIELKPVAEALKMKKVSNFNEMIELFSKDRASGALAETAKERNARFQMNDNINLETVQKVDDFCAANDVIMESQYNIDDDIQVVHPTPSPPKQSSSAKKCKSRKRKVEENEDLASMIMNDICSVANAISEGNKVLERVYHREYTGEEIYNALESMGLESHELRRALRYLVDNQADARALFSCPSQIRLGLLRDMMESDN